jgi:MFS family permease
MLSSFFKTRHHATLTLMLTAALLEMSGYFMLSPLLVLSLNAKGVPHSVIGLFSAMSWIALLLSAPFAAGWVARLGTQTTLRLCALLPLIAAIMYSLSSALWLWFVIAFTGSLASSLRWICSESTVAALASDETRARWVSAYSSMMGLTFIVGPALLSVLITDKASMNAGVNGGANSGISNSVIGQMPWIVALVLIASGAALTFLLRLPNDDRVSNTASSTPLSDLLNAAKTTPHMVLAGLLGGFFEVGLNGVLPLYGLSLGWSAAQSTVLVSVSAIGGILGVVLTGWATGTRSRAKLMVMASGLLVFACAMQWAVSALPQIAWLVVALWGAVGASLYILVMVQVGADYVGQALIQRTALLVMSYTVGGLLAPALGGWALQLSQAHNGLAFQLLTGTVASVGFVVMGWLYYRSAAATPSR